MKYIGTHPKSQKSKGNLGDIWELKEDGKWECIEGQHKGFTLKQWQIDNDVSFGYLKPME